MVPTLTHYAPWDEDGARCGAPVTSDRAHSLFPSCPVCAASCALLDDPPPAEVETGAPVRDALIAARADRVARYQAACRLWFRGVAAQPSSEAYLADLAAIDAQLDGLDDAEVPAADRDDDGPDWRRLVALVDRIAQVYTVDTDQHALVRLVDDARAVRAGGRR